MLGAGHRARRRARTVVHGHFQVHRHAKAAVGESLNPHNFRYIFAVHRVMRRAEGKSHKNAHSLIVAAPPRVKINAFF